LCVVIRETGLKVIDMMQTQYRTAFRAKIAFYKIYQCSAGRYDDDTSKLCEGD